jgi:hypothetical protein
MRFYWDLPSCTARQAANDACHVLIEAYERKKKHAWRTPPGVFFWGRVGALIEFRLSGDVPDCRPSHTERAVLIDLRRKFAVSPVVPEPPKFHRLASLSFSPILPTQVPIVT